MPRPQFTLRALLVAVSVSAIGAATLRALWGSVRLATIAGAFSSGVLLVLCGVRAIQNGNLSAWPVLLALLGIFPIALGIVGTFVYFIL
jgi:hypothetical protein